MESSVASRPTIYNYKSIVYSVHLRILVNVCFRGNACSC